MAIHRTLILVRNAETLAELSRLAEFLPGARGRGLVFEVVSGDVQHAVTQLRERERDPPIGFIAPDEAEAFAALAGGADEALVLKAHDAPSMNAFVDRVELRARLRAET